jgi:uncharacterized protein YkwD
MLATPDELAGKAVRCPQCSQVVQVRAQGLRLPPALPPTPAPPLAVPVPAASPPSPAVPHRSWPNLWTPASVVLGVLSLPLAVALGKPLVGIILLGIGLGLGVAGLAVCVSRRGAGFGLGLTAVAVCASGLYVAVKLPGDPPAGGGPPAQARNEQPKRETPPRPPEKTPPTNPKQTTPPPAEPVPEPADPVPPPRTDEQKAARAIERLNVHRRHAGVSAVTLDEELSKGCKAHAAYLARHHDHSRTRELGPHKEDPNLEGYSPEGEQAGRTGAIYVVKTNLDPHKYDPSDVEAVDSLVSTFFHRIPLLHPDLRHMGFAYALQRKGKDSVWVTVMDIRDTRRPDGSSGWVVLYPGAGQADVPTTFTNFEQPNPTPPEGFGKSLGYCVTATFARSTKVEDAEATLADASGTPVAAWVTTPTRPAGERNMQQNTVCLIAKSPLKPRTAYTATVTARVDGQDWKRSWTFTTGAE